MFKQIYLIILVPSLTISSQLLLKKGLNLTSGTNTIFKVILSPYVIGGVIISGIGFVLWLILISKMDLSKALPYSTGIFYLELVIFSRLFLGETLSISRLLSIILIAAGVIILGRS